MKKIVFSIVFLAGLSVASMAQQHNHGEGQGQQNHQGGQGGHGGGGGQRLTTTQKAQKVTQDMTTQLSLTADQQTKIAALNLSKAQQDSTIRAKYQGNMQSAQTELKTAKSQYNTNLKSILTADQATKWEAIKQQRQQGQGQQEAE
jgi:protein CpxP